MKQENEIKFRWQKSVNRRSRRNYILTHSKGSKKVIKYVPVLAINRTGLPQDDRGNENLRQPPRRLSAETSLLSASTVLHHRDEERRPARLVSGINYCRKRIKTRSQESNSLVPQRPALSKESSSTHKTQHAIKAATALARHPVTIDPLGSLPRPRPDPTHAGQLA